MHSVTFSRQAWIIAGLFSLPILRSIQSGNKIVMNLENLCQNEYCSPRLLAGGDGRVALLEFLITSALDSIGVFVY